jgi:cell division septal protein FtsQ
LKDASQHGMMAQAQVCYAFLLLLFVFFGVYFFVFVFWSLTHVKIFSRREDAIVAGKSNGRWYK